ncbi:hypothetical protein V6N12_064285 [Hibiscus sabdariffa]|uniref:Transmembrane protein 208 n=1 Tax=Hibiscus sabdariffa TaxID=183260 RepID=A0ABR2G654_9ROSI
MKVTSRMTQDTQAWEEIVNLALKVGLTFRELNLYMSWELNKTIENSKKQETCKANFKPFVVDHLSPASGGLFSLDREMANQGAKKRKEENTRHMANLRRLIIACNVIYVLVRMLIFHSSITWKHCVGLLLTSVAYFFPYQQLAQMAKPSYADGELLDGGFDMSTGGICGYLHDIIYITSFVQLASIISDKFWYTYLVIPAFGAYKSFGSITGFLSQGSEGEVEDEKTRKKREKMERKASRPKLVKTRNR